MIFAPLAATLIGATLTTPAATQDRSKRSCPAVSNSNKPRSVSPELPERDAAGRSSVAGVYLAGDGAGILGADAAEWAGERAALALLSDAGAPLAPADTVRATALERKLERAASFRHGLERAFPFPADWAAQCGDDVMVCRCEGIAAGELRTTARAAGIVEINRLKALTRVGMGRCQGRMCGVAATEVLAQCAGRTPEGVGRLRGQAPVKPIPFSLIDSGSELEESGAS